MEKIGFSDLWEDEAIVVSLFRSWAAWSRSPALFESKVSESLRHDPLQEVLGIVFETFRELDPDVIVWTDVGDVLSQHEERLLDALAVSLSHTASPGWCKSDPTGVLRFRPVAAIPRSGRDRILQKLHTTSWQFAVGR